MPWTRECVQPVDCAVLCCAVLCCAVLDKVDKVERRAGFLEPCRRSCRLCLSHCLLADELPPPSAVLIMPFSPLRVPSLVMRITRTNAVVGLSQKGKPSHSPTAWEQRHSKQALPPFPPMRRRSTLFAQCVHTQGTSMLVVDQAVATQTHTHSLSVCLSVCLSVSHTHTSAPARRRPLAAFPVGLGNPKPTWPSMCAYRQGRT
ncbi:uncharacterized protein K460DRAFT_33766 [Cucurbitaria berberidis CBS 394.84]|uniref:Uncharacterized protein n=1 Tax=Cucurbitaria berberidis CBS 394.84 TaxID=1168544 RepID=A0A9P4GTD4_9PLEO|nr:uncharacterized protein K460DRAFT_33766 [Cucurbitaria berberidis CBS 394.84]KAF1851385.1 hypothetical protein K460DRAFT_33766 [Cucurbitaria berberidis CBS 394.84]